MGVFSPGGASPATNVNSTIVGPDSPVIVNTVIALADTEQSYALPAGTSRFMIKVNGADLKLAYAPGTSGTTFLTVPRWCFYTETDISPTSLTLYFQSPLVGLSIEIVSWS